MDLLSFLGVLGRHKLVTTLMVLASAAAVGAFVVSAPRVYQAKATLVLLNPPPAPTRAEIKQNPALGAIHAANPYARFGDLSIVVDLVAQAVEAPSTRDRFAAEGFPGDYTAARSYATNGPIIEIAARGASRSKAIAFATRVEEEFRAELALPQVERHVDTNYQVRADTIVPPDRAAPVLASLIRSGLALLALCAFATIVVASLADGLARFRRNRRLRRESEGRPRRGRRLAYSFLLIAVITAAAGGAFWFTSRPAASDSFGGSSVHVAMAAPWARTLPAALASPLVGAARIDPRQRSLLIPLLTAQCPSVEIRVARRCPPVAPPAASATSPTP